MNRTPDADEENSPLTSLPKIDDGAGAPFAAPATGRERTPRSPRRSP